MPVIFLTGKWVAQISISCKRTHLGYFNTEYEAAVRYDKKARELSRPLNFPSTQENGAEQAKKSDSAVIVGPNAGFTKGPYRKRAPTTSETTSTESLNDIAEGGKQRKKRVVVETRTEPESAAHTPYFNPEMIMQMFIQQQSMLRATEDQAVSENQPTRDTNVADMLMQLASRDYGYDGRGHSTSESRTVVRM